MKVNHVKKAVLEAAFKEIGRRGGIARAQKMTAAARSEAARLAVTARWEKARAARRVEDAVAK